MSAGGSPTSSTIRTDDRSHLAEQQSSINEEHHRIIDAIARADRSAFLEVLTSHAERFRMRIRRFVTGRPLAELETIVGAATPRA